MREISIHMTMPEHEWEALAQSLKRVDYDTCCRFAAVYFTYGARSEGDVMWSGICLLQRELANAGFAPR